MMATLESLLGETAVPVSLAAGCGFSAALGGRLVYTKARSQECDVIIAGSWR
jgi:hypothetical protein